MKEVRRSLALSLYLALFFVFFFFLIILLSSCLLLVSVACLSSLTLSLTLLTSLFQLEVTPYEVLEDLKADLALKLSLWESLKGWREMVEELDQASFNQLGECPPPLPLPLLCFC